MEKSKPSARREAPLRAVLYKEEMMQQIITIQHTQSEHHTNGMVGSWTDWHRTLYGRAQAERIAQRLLPLLQGQTWTL